MIPYGPFGNMMPYSNFHGMNLDWVIQIAKDFLDQYTHIQETIDEGLDELDAKATALQALLQEWYDTHSEDIADQLAQALSDLNDWYTAHEGYLNDILAANVQSFQEQAIDIVNETIESIPEDYTALSNKVTVLEKQLGTTTENLLQLLPTASYTNHAVSIVNNYDGGFTLSGTATANGATIITPEITLPAGTYKAGYFSNSPVNLQIRKYVDHADAGSVIQTTSSSEFTLAETTNVVARLYVANGTTYSATVYPALMLSSNWDSFVANYVAKDTVARQGVNELKAHYFSIPAVPNNSDLDDLKTPGLYRIMSTYTYTHLPTELSGSNAIIQVMKMPDTQYTVQNISSYGFAIPYVVVARMFSGSPGQWTSWAVQLDASDLEYGKIIPTETDFDDLTEKQIYRAVSGYTYEHIPDGFKGNYTVEVIPFTPNYILQRAMNYGNKALQIATRIKSGSPSTWSDWNNQLNINEINASISINPSYTVESFTRKSYSSQGANTGLNLKVVSYNVANYNNDTSRYLPDDKLINLKKFFMNYNPDFIMMQEDTQYIDGSSQEATPYVFNPVWPYVAGTGGPTIRSKINSTESETLRYANGRALRYALFEIEDKTLLIVSTHPSPVSDPDGISKRAAQYTELFNWLTHQVSMETYAGGTYVECPTYTHAIIGMDANSAYDDDKDNLETAATANGFVLANGGPLGWCVTHPENRTYPDLALDNIIVSDNIIINNFATYLNQFKELYSDHVPISAGLTLL